MGFVRRAAALLLVVGLVSCGGGGGGGDSGGGGTPPTPVGTQGVVSSIGPGVLVSGKATSIIVRGTGFAAGDDVAAVLKITGAAPLSVTRISDTALSVQMPALAAGSYRVAYGSGVPTADTATLQVVDPQIFAAATNAGSHLARTMVYEPVRKNLFVANEGASRVERLRFNGTSWVRDNLAFGSIYEIGLSLDGNTLVVAEQDKLHLVDTTSFTIRETFPTPGPVAYTAKDGHPLPIGNDGKVWLPISPAGTYNNFLYSFDLRTHGFTQETVRAAGLPVRTQFPGGPWFDISRDGERMTMIQTTVTTPSMSVLHRDSTVGTWHNHPAILANDYSENSYGGLGDTGERFLFEGKAVYDRAFNLVGELQPETGWQAMAAALSPDGSKAYLLTLPPDWQTPGGTTMPKLLAFNATAAGTSPPQLDLLGSVDLTAFPSCRSNMSLWCWKHLITVTPDGNTVFVHGNERLVVVPLPTNLKGF
jgi:hypothetical protein